MQRALTFSGWAILTLVLGSGGGAGALAGPLNPPIGPVISTYKTLTEVEPRTAISATNTPGDADSVFRITQPGSYYLTGNITGVGFKHGIEIAASGVTLDLNGFDLAGVADSLDGVFVSVVIPTNISVINGSVRDWGQDGVDLREGDVRNSRIVGVRASGNLQHGIASGSENTISDCLAHLNGGNGIFALNACTISNCSASQNTGDGIFAGIGCTISECSVFGNSNGILADDNCALSSCSSIGNQSDGIRAGSGSAITNCSASNNSGSGIVTPSGSTITNCSASSNSGSSSGPGIFTGDGCTIIGCSVSSNFGSGIVAGRGSSITNCSAYVNSGDGISVSFSSTVADCFAQGNNLDGIVCVSDCTIRGNTCSVNGQLFGAGITVSGGRNRIEGNHCTSNPRGIVVDGFSNVIIKNTCSFNTFNNWEVAAGNVLAPIEIAGTNLFPVFGDSYGGLLGTTDPNSNYTH